MVNNKNVVGETKNLMEYLKSRMTTDEEHINELKDARTF